MTMPVHLSKFQWFMAALAVLLVAFAGSIAGSWFAGWRQDKAYREKLEQHYASNPAKLEPGDPFPQAKLIDPDGNEVNTAELTEGYNTLVFFLSSACDMCSDLIEVYRYESGNFPSGIRAFAVCPDRPYTAGVYASEHSLPFPIYCDTAQSFQFIHGVIAFPTLIALDARGMIQYTNFGMMEDYDFGKILKRLNQ